MTLKDKIVDWLRDWFEENGKECKAVVGCSGGKDSSVVAALCVEALGKDRVLGVLMPDGEQQDIDYSYKLVEFLNIPYVKINIKDCKDKLVEQLHNSYLSMTEQAKCNLPPRLRMSALYAVAQCVDGRVLNTCNLSETLLGWETRWGDAVGDVAPIANLTVTEVKQLGYELGLPKELIEKTPSDGLCGSSDEEKLGISYKVFDEYISSGICEDEEMKQRIIERVKSSQFKRKRIPTFISYRKTLLSYPAEIRDYI